MSDTNIDITIHGKKRSPEDDNWPLIIEDDDQVMTSFSISFFDGATKKSGEDWIDVPEWYLHQDANMTEIYNWTDTTTFKGPEFPFLACPKNVEVKIYANEDSRVPADVITTEYGTDNPDRWERKPLAPVLDSDVSEEANENHVWISGQTVLTESGGADSSHAVFNIYCELVQSVDRDPFAYCNMDLFFDEEHKRIRPKKTTGEAGTYPDLGYRSPPIRKKFGIRVSEKGGKTYCHYTAGPDDTYYVREWIEGIHYCPFDTMDSDNFKVTKEPDYEAEEVNGNFLTDGRWSCYLMPRRVAYFVRYRHHEITEDYETYAFPSGYPNCGGVIDEITKPWNNAASPPAWSDAASYGPTDCVTHGGLYWVNKGGGTLGLEPGNEGSMQAWDFPVWEEVTADQLTEHSDHNVDALMDIVRNGDDSITARVANSTHYLGIFWGRLPSDLSESAQIVELWGGEYGPFEENQQLCFWEWVYEYIAPAWQWVIHKRTAIEIPWYETRDDARIAWEEAGGDSELTSSVVLCGANTSEMHIHQDSSDYTNWLSYGIYTADGPTSSYYGTIDQIRHGPYCDPINNMVEDEDILNTYYGGSADAPEIESRGVKRLWEVIEESDFWKDTINTLREAALAWEDDATPASMIDNIPYGVALSPTKAGSLVAVLRKGSRAYFVWRRTDEDLDALMMILGNDDNTVHCSFESRHLDGFTDRCAEFGYVPKDESYWPPTHLRGVYGGEYADQFSGEADEDDTPWAAETYYGVGDKCLYNDVHFKRLTAGNSESEWNETEAAKWASLGVGSRKLTHVGRAIALQQDPIEDGTDCNNEIGFLIAFCTEIGQIELAAPLYVMASKERALIDYNEWENVGDSAAHLGQVSFWGASTLGRGRTARSFVSDLEGWSLPVGPPDRPLTKDFRNAL